MAGCQSREENAADLARDEKRRAILKADSPLSGDLLDGKYNRTGDGEHPLFSRANWRVEVAHQNTVLGYWDWVAHAVYEACLEELPR